MTDSFYEHHVFVCTHLKTDGKKCCQQGNAEAMAAYMKERLQALGLHGEGKVRVSRSGCLGRCGQGPNIVVYPEGSWHSYSCKEDVDQFVESLVIDSKSGLV